MKAELQKEPVPEPATEHVPAEQAGGQQMEAVDGGMMVNGGTPSVLGLDKSPDELYSGPGSSTTSCSDEVEGPPLDADQIIRDWISVEDGTVGSCPPNGRQRQAVVCEFPTGWVAVEAPTGSSSTSSKASSASPPPTTVEWVTVDVPSKDKASSTQDDLCFRETDHDSSEMEAPRTRRRRTISAKIRARIEAFENSFRQELDRLNSPLGKSKSSRIHEAFRRVSVDGRASEDLEAEIKQLSLDNDEMIDIDLDTTVLPEGSWLAPTTADQVFKPDQGCQAEEDEEEEGAGEEEAKSTSELVLIQERTETSDDQTSSTTADESHDKAGDEQAVSAVVELTQTEEVTNFEALEASKEFQTAAAERSIGAGAFMKQVISGAALLAGLIFLWPRGNNLIWRNSQKKQRYYLVNQGASHKKDRRYSHPIGRMNFEVEGLVRVLRGGRRFYRRLKIRQEPEQLFKWAEAAKRRMIWIDRWSAAMEGVEVELP